MLIKQIGIRIILLLLIQTTLSAHQINQMFKYISQDQLYISEPSPQMFGNPDNADKAINWLKSRFHFSFAEYHNPSNQQFGVIRVINDDLVQPNRGFGTHPHANMEIVSYIISGELTHQDSKHNKETLGRGSIQYMSAGEGVFHSEFNLSPKEPCRFLQIWILPREKNTKVNYSSYRGMAGQSENKWFHLISDQKQDIASQGKINQDCNIFVNQFDQTQKFEVLAKRQVYLVCVEGSFILTSFGKEEQIKQHDGVKLFSDFTLKPTFKSHVLILEMAQQTIKLFNKMEKQLIKQNESLQVQLDALLQENLSLREKLAEAPPPPNPIKNSLKIPDILEKQLQLIQQENRELNGKLTKYLEIIDELKSQLAQKEIMLSIFQKQFIFEFSLPTLDQKLKTACLQNQAQVYEDKSLSITTFTSFMDGIITIKYTLTATKAMQIDFQCRRTVNLQIDMPIERSILVAHQPSEFTLNIKINRLPYELPAIFFIFNDQQVSQLVPCSVNKTFLPSTCNEFNDQSKIDCKVSSLKGIPEKFQFENQNFKLTLLDNKSLQISGPPEISQHLITQLLPLLVD